MMAGFVDFLRKALGWLSSPAVTPPVPPTRVLRASGRLDTLPTAAGSLDTTFAATGRTDVAANVNLGCSYGEDVDVEWTLRTGEDVTDWTLVAELLAAEGDVAAVSTGTVVKTGASAATITFASAATSHFSITRWRVCRTDLGGKAVLTKGRWPIGGERVSGVA